MATQNNPIKSELLAWHEQFATCVRTQDFAGGSTLFAPECLGFGTVVEIATGRERLMQNQWQRIWNATRGFHFLPDSFEFILSPDNSLACVMTLWESIGTGQDGAEFLRRGRCTTLLRRTPGISAGWKAVHTHYSKTPDGSI